MGGRMLGRRMPSHIAPAISILVVTSKLEMHPALWNSKQRIRAGTAGITQKTRLNGGRKYRKTMHAF